MITEQQFQSNKLKVVQMPPTPQVTDAVVVYSQIPSLQTLYNNLVQDQRMIHFLAG